MESCGGSQAGCFHIELSLKKVARLVLGWNMDVSQQIEPEYTNSEPFEEAREGEMER